MLKAGNLDRRVTLLRRELVHDGAQKVERFVAIGERWASRKPLAVRERNEGERRVALGQYSLWLRWDSLTVSLTGKDAVAIDGRRYELIETPLEVGFRDGIELKVADTGEDWSPG